MEKWIKILDNISSVENDSVQGIYVDQQMFCLTKRNNEFSMLQGLCPHADAPLWEGNIDPESGKLICPRHRWSFDCITGKDSGDYIDLKTYPIKQENGSLFVQLNKTSEQ